MNGLDFLALPKYVNTVVKEMPEGWALGCFANTFGDAYPSVEKVLSLGRTPLVRVHLLWSDTHTYGDKDISIIRKEAKKYEKLKQRYLSVEFQLSPFCEHNIKNPDKYLDIIKQEAPSCTPINTPWKGRLSSVYKNEIHGKSRPINGRYNFSFDGTPCVDVDIEQYKSNHFSAEVFFYWDARFNGKWEATDTTPRPQRKGWPDSNLIDSIIYLSTHKGLTKLLPKWLFKSHSENKGNGDPRAEKPVFICPIKAKELRLKTRNGQVVDSLKYYGIYQDRYRYYSSTYGYLTAEKTRRIQGDPLSEVWIGNTKYGIINPGFRSGEFR